MHQIPKIPDELRKTYRDYKYKQKSLSSTECLEFIKAVALETIAIKGIAQVNPQIFVTIDALDECPEYIRCSFLTGMKSLRPMIQLFFTSRHVGSILDTFSKVERLEICASQSYLKLYLRGRLANEIRLLCMIQNERAMYEIIVDKIAEQANGMYVTLMGSLSCMLTL